MSVAPLPHLAEPQLRARGIVRALLGLPGERPGPCTYTELVCLGARDPTFRPSTALNQVLHEFVELLEGGDVDGDAEVRHLASQLVACHPPYQRRAQAVRAISGRAEASMELAYAPLMANQARLPGASLDASRQDALQPFPYGAHYRELLTAETALTPPLGHWVVAGAGPAPLSGLWLHWLTGARVTLLDRDPKAVRAAQRLIRRLESRGLLPRDALSTQIADITRTEIPADAEGVLVAALVPGPAKVALAQQLAASNPRRWVLVRSAHGLTAQLAYPPSPRAALRAAGLSFLGEVVPRTHVTPGPRLPGLLNEQDPRLIRTSSHQLLNSTELYRS